MRATVCYHCGREFVHTQRSMLHRLHRHRHCPVCHFSFKAVDCNPVGGDSGVHRPHLKSKRSIVVYFLSWKGRNPRKLQHDHTKVPTTESPPSTQQVAESEISDIGATGEACLYRGVEECPFAFAYDTEEIELYQIDKTQSHDEVEGYQLEWLLSNIP